MNAGLVVAVDARSGDHGAEVAVPAALDVLASTPDLRLTIVGRGELVRPLLGAALESGRCSFVEATEVVAMDERPQDALRRKKNSSMRVAINLVEQGEASACVSAGNTGALLATARFVLGMVLLAATVYGVIKASGGEMTRIPALGDFIERVPF